MSDKPWERDWSGQGSTGTGKPWERDWGSGAPAAPLQPERKGGFLDAVNSVVDSAMAAKAAGAEVPVLDEIKRGLTNINENWIAPAIGGIPDMVGRALGMDSDLTGLLREGMRDIGASGGPGYMPQTTVGGLLSDVVGGAASVLPVLATAGAAAPAVGAGTVGKGVAAQLAAQPAAQLAAGAGAGAGDFLAKEIDPESPWLRIAGQLGGALGVGMLTMKPQPDDVIAAFERQDVPVSAGLTAGQGSGGTSVQAIEAGGLGTTIGGAGTVRKTYDAAEGAIGSAVDRLAAQTGAVQSADDLGRVLQGSVARTMDDVSQQADEAFSAIGGLFGADDRFLAQNTQRALASSFDNIDDPALAALVRDPRFAKYAEALAGSGGQLSYNSLKGFRSYIGRAMNRLSLDSGADNAQLKALYGALTDDMAAALSLKGGQPAVDAFKSANAWYAAQMEKARNSLQPLVGKGSPVNAEKAFDTLYSAAKAKGGNLQRLQDIYGGLTPQEQADVAASILARLGRKGDDPFSVARFMADYSALSADAKDLLFNSQMTGALRQSYDDLLEVIMPQFRRAARFINRSNTGLGVVGGGQAVLAAQQAMSLDLLTAVATLAGPAVMAKAMTNPAVVKLLADGVARGQSASQIAAQVTAIIQAQRGAR